MREIKSGKVIRNERGSLFVKWEEPMTKEEIENFRNSVNVLAKNKVHFQFKEPNDFKIKCLPLDENQYNYASEKGLINKNKEVLFEECVISNKPNYKFAKLTI